MGYYDPRVGRFTQEDSVEGKISDPLSLNRYSYALNNPIMYFDPSGHIPTAKEAAQMASHIYEQKGELSGGWKFDYSVTGGDGMVMGIYMRLLDQYDSNGLQKMEYALVNKGTTATSLSDWNNNVTQLFGNSADMKASIAYAKSFVEYVGSDIEVTFVGHSKGGAEAAANAVATNKNCIIFNPATVNLEAYDLSSSNYTASMTAFIVKGDALNTAEGWFSEPIDKAVYLTQQHGGHWYDAWQTSEWQRVQNHLMPAVMSALKQDGWWYN